MTPVSTPRPKDRTPVPVTTPKTQVPVATSLPKDRTPVPVATPKTQVRVEGEGQRLVFTNVITPVVTPSKAITKRKAPKRKTKARKGKARKAKAPKTSTVPSAPTT